MLWALCSAEAVPLGGHRLTEASQARDLGTVMCDRATYARWSGSYAAYGALAPRAQRVWAAIRHWTSRYLPDVARSLRCRSPSAAPLGQVCGSAHGAAPMHDICLPIIQTFNQC